MPLTDVAIKNLRPQEKSYKVFDGGGLYIEVLKTGTKVWRVKYRFGGKEKRLTLGEYPLIGLKAARSLLNDAKEQLAHGVDPSDKKHEEAASGMTFRAVGSEWITRQAPKWSDKYRETLKSRLERFVYS